MDVLDPRNIEKTIVDHGGSIDRRPGCVYIFYVDRDWET